MPAFPAAAGVTTVNEDITVQLYSYKKRIRGTSFPDNGGDPASVTAAVEALANLSNMGLLSYTYSGTTTFIEQGTATVYDDMHDDTRTLTTVFQDTGGVGPEVALRIPAPRSDLMIGGVLLDNETGYTLVTDFINSMIATLNGPSAAPIYSYTFVSGTLDTASDREKRKLPVVSESSAPTTS